MANIAGNQYFRPTFRNSKTSPYLENHVILEMMSAPSKGHYFNGRTRETGKKTNKASKVDNI